MKKRYLLLALAGLILGYTAKAQHWFEDERELYFPITKEQLRASVKAQWAESNSKKSSQLNIVEVISTKQLAQAQKQAELFKGIQERLGREYTMSGHRYDREVTQRLNLLQAMSHDWPSDKVLLHVSPGELKQLLLGLAKNNTENIQVRRQAYKYWMAYSSASGLISSEKARVANLATHSDSKLMGSLADSAE